jgi:hypothetical protein
MQVRRHRAPRSWPAMITRREKRHPPAGSLSPNIHLCWFYSWFGCLRADRPVMAAGARMPAHRALRVLPARRPERYRGRPGSSPPAPATHSAGADHPACRSPQAKHRCSGDCTLRLCQRLGCYRRPARRPRSRADPPAATSAPASRRCLARWCCVGTRARTGRLNQAPARPSGGPPDPARPRSAGHQHKAPARKSTPQRPRRLAQRRHAPVKLTLLKMKC